MFLRANGTIFQPPFGTPDYTHRILFGTDIPLLDPAPQLAKAMAVDVSADDRALYMGGNILRLMGVSA